MPNAGFSFLNTAGHAVDVSASLANCAIFCP